MEGKESDIHLPEDLVEKIIAMMPFPQIFKARALSRTWLVRLSTKSWQYDEETRSLVRRFHQLVEERSKNWKIYWPCKVTPEWDHLVVHDCVNGTSQNLVSISFLSHLSRPSVYVKREGGLLVSKLSQPAVTWRMEGALLFLAIFRLHEEELYVANVLTRSYKRLPHRPRTSGEIVVWIKALQLLNHESSPCYKVVLLSRQKGRRHQQPQECYLQFYDSKSQLWDKRKSVHSELMGHIGRPVYMNGALYMLNSVNLDWWNQKDRLLIVSNFQEGNLEVHHLQGNLSRAVSVRNNNATLVVCDVGLMMAVPEDSLTSKFRIFIVMKIETGFQLVQLSLGPPAALGALRIPGIQVVGHRDCIYFDLDDSLKQIQGPEQLLAYSVPKNEWMLIPFPSGVHHFYNSLSFQPGLNPFMSV